MWHWLSDLDWGSVPAWFAAGTLGVAVRTARGEYQRRLREQASHVHVLLGPTTYREGRWRAVEVTVANSGDQPVSDLAMLVVGDTVSPEASFGDHREFLEGGARWVVTVPYLGHDVAGPVAAERALVGHVSFSDGNGYRWTRWSTGGLYPPIERRPQRGLPRATARALPDHWVARWLRRPGRRPVRARDYPYRQG